MPQALRERAGGDTTVLARHWAAAALDEYVEAGLVEPKAALFQSVAAAGYLTGRDGWAAAGGPGDD